MSTGPTQATALAVTVPVGDAALEGDVALPEGAHGVVVFAHGSGSGRRSPRNRLVADRLNRAGLSTLLVDLLTSSEEGIDAVTGEDRFDIELLARRLGGVVDWLPHGPASDLPVGLFGASTGAAAALIVAAERPHEIDAVVSRGGRPDLVAMGLARVVTPTLFIVGGADPQVLQLNRQAFVLLGAAVRELVVVRGASHLFEEPGALEEVARLAADWFSDYLGGPDASR